MLDFRARRTSEHPVKPSDEHGVLLCPSCRQVYLGGYEEEEAAAEAYDMAALKSKGAGCPTNFPPGKQRPLP